MTKFFALLATGILGAVCTAQEGLTSRITQVLSGSFPGAGSTLARTSADGRYIAFQSRASNIVFRDFNTHFDVFVHDSNLGITECMSRKPDGEYTVVDSTSPDISDDGRYVVFRSGADNLVPGDTNGQIDVFVRDSVTRITTRVSVGVRGTESNGESRFPRISGDGNYVVFVSYATNLVPNDSNGYADAFRYSMETGVTECVSLGDHGVQGNSDTITVDISGSGERVAFSSRATNLVGPFSFYEQVYVRDIPGATTVRASVNAVGMPANAWTSNVAISSQGDVVAFESSADNLMPGDLNGRQDIFARNIVKASVFPSGSMLSVVFERSSPLGSIDTMEFEVEASVSAAGVTRTIELYDFDAESYEMFNEAPATQEDESVVVHVSSNATRFVGPSGQLRARVAFAIPGPNLLRWQAYFDHVRWTVD